MEQISSCKANTHLASQEIPHTLWNPKAYYCVRRIPTLFPILS